eukprot:g2435.t1
MSELRKICRIFIQLLVPLWFVLAPIGIFLYICFIPFRFVYPCGVVEAEKEGQKKLSVTVAGNVTKTSKGDVLFVHGWPDSEYLWSRMSTYFVKDYRCIYVTLPQHDGLPRKGWGLDFDEIANQLVSVIEENKKGDQVTVICHDWGCYHTYNAYRRRPELFKRMACLDVAPDSERSASFLLFSVAYQWFNIFCFFLGPAGTVVMRITCKYFFNFKARPSDELHSSMNYSYYYLWRAIFFGSRASKKLRFPPSIRHFNLKKCPVYFAYGSKKICMFHSKRWLDALRANPSQCEVSALDCGHWIPIEKSREVSDKIVLWMRKTE